MTSTRKYSGVRKYVYKKKEYGAEQFDQMSYPPYCLFIKKNSTNKRSFFLMTQELKN